MDVMSLHIYCHPSFELCHIARYSHQTFLEGEKIKVLQNEAAVTKEINGIGAIGLLVMYNVQLLISCFLTIHLLIPICKCLRRKVYILLLFCNLRTKSRNHEHMPLFGKKSPSVIF